MGTTKSRKSRRNNSRPTALTFLSNIALGSENDLQVNNHNALLQNLELHSPTPYPNCVTVSHTDSEANHKPDNKDECTNNNNNNNEYQPTNEIRTGSLDSTDSNFSADDTFVQTAVHSERSHRAVQTLAAASSVMTPAGVTAPTSSLLTKQLDQKKANEQQRRRLSTESNNDDVWHHKLTREDSERPIASEKIKKKANHAEKENSHGGSGIMSVVRYYTEKIKISGKRKSPDQTANRGYLQQQLASNDNHRRRHAISYGHFLDPSHSLDNDDVPVENEYDPYYLDNDSYNRFNLLSGSQGTVGGQTLRPSELKRELNEQFRRDHPEIPSEITLSKIRSIKLHLLEIGKAVDLEISSIAHAFVYFEKLVIKNVVTKRNRKLIAACCIFLATKVNEAKGTWFEPLYEAIDNELDVDSKELREHEFAVFADLEFNLYIRQREFMPHFNRIFQELDYKSIEEYIGDSVFYKVTK